MEVMINDIVKVVNETDDWGWGVIVNFEKLQKKNILKKSCFLTFFQKKDGFFREKNKNLQSHNLTKIFFFSAKKIFFLVAPNISNVLKKKLLKNIF